MNGTETNIPCNKENVCNSYDPLPVYLLAQRTSIYLRLRYFEVVEMWFDRFSCSHAFANSLPLADKRACGRGSTSQANTYTYRSTHGQIGVLKM